MKKEKSSSDKKYSDKVKVEFTVKELIVIKLCLEKLDADVAKHWSGDPDIQKALRAIRRMRDKILFYVSEVEYDE